MLTRAFTLTDSAQSRKASEDRFDVIDETSSLGDAFAASTPVPINPAPGDDDPQAIESARAPSPEPIARAEALLGRARKAAGEDRFPAAVACALLGRSNGHSELDAWGILENLNQAVFEPPLEPSRLRDAIYAAYVEPVVAEQIIAGALSGAANVAPVDDIRPPGALVRAEVQYLPADHETPLAEPDTGTVDLSAAVGPGAHDTRTGDNALARPVTTKITRKVGRPPGRMKDRLFQMRVANTFITKIDDWRRQQPDFPNRTESVRRLVQHALNGRRG